MDYMQTATNVNDPIFNWPDSFAQYDTQTQQVVQTSGDTAKAKINGVVSFSSWLMSAYPDVYNAVIQARPEIFLPELAMAGLAGLGQDSTTAAATAQDQTQAPSTSWGQTVSDLIDKIAAPLVGLYSEKQLIDVNIKRAEQGLSPLTDTSQIAPTVNVQAGPALMQPVQDMGKILVVGVLGLGALLLFTRRKR